MALAPIALFTYARVEHSRKVVESLLRNKEAEESDLIIFSDGPKKMTQADAVVENRKYIHTIAGFKSVRIIEREKNWGLARSLIDGITSVVREYGKVIVVEDDLIVAPHFLEFMNQALDKYESEEMVFAVSGYFSTSMGRTFFLRNFNCWGWGTWKRAWNYFIPDAGVLKRQILSMHAVKHFDIDYTYPYYRMLEMQEDGKIDSWAIQYYASIFVKEGLVLYPSSPLVTQNGMDGSGTHCGVCDSYGVELTKGVVKLSDIPMIEDTEGYAQLKNFCRSIYHGKRAWLEKNLLKLKILLHIL